MATAGPFGLPPIHPGGALAEQAGTLDGLVLGGPGPYGVPPLHGAQGGSGTLAEDTDVVLSIPADGDLLRYDGASAKWKNVDGRTIGHYQILMTGAAPPDPISTPDNTDYVYGWVS